MNWKPVIERYEKELLESVIPFWETDGRRLVSLKLLPILISCGEGKHVEGLPQVATDLAFMDRLAELCRPYGVSFRMENGVAVEMGTYDELMARGGFFCELVERQRVDA